MSKQKSNQFVSSISDEFVDQYKDKTPPWGPTGFVVFKRTYARRLEGQNRTEEWYESIKRCVNGLLKIGGKFTKREIETLYDKVFNLKCCFSGRALWQLGTATVDKLGGDSLQNCWHVAINEPVEPFCFVFDELMLGGGVGFNIQAEQVYEIPKVKYDVNIVRRDEKDVDFIVPDNREGWIDLLRRTLTAFFFTGKSFSYSTICIRGKGTLIKSFGGTASGPEDLCKGICQIVDVLKASVGRKLRPIDCLDILNIIGAIVVAGNVRRSAQISLGDMDDTAYLDAKNWAKGVLPPWRGMSNNSVVCDDFSGLPDKFWSGYNGDGEPYGLVNLSNCRKYGRLADGKNYRPDKDVIGVNPCGELPLSSFESCNLAEIFLPNIKDEAEFKVVAELLLKATKTISCLPFIHEQTNKVVSKNHRLGVGVTGFLQAPHLRVAKVFDSVYKHMEQVDKWYSRVIGVPTSIKLTTVKPSGCRPWDALTTTDHGILTLEELFKDHAAGSEWDTYKGAASVIQDDGSNKITRTFSNGVRKTVNVRTSYNIEIESTTNHPWFVKMRYDRSKGKKYANVGEWIPAGDISEGDILEIVPGIYSNEKHAELVGLNSLALKMRGDATDILQPKFMNPDLAWLLGYLWGDGAQSPAKYRIRFTDGVHENLAKASRIIVEQFGLEYNPVPASEGRNCQVLEIASKMLWHWLIKNDVYKYFAGSIDMIPLVVRSSTEEDIIAFIAGLLDSDGGVSAREKENVCNISTANAMFANHLQHVALAVGLVFGRSHNTKGENFQDDKSMFILGLTPESIGARFDLLKKHSVKISCKMLRPDLPWSHERAGHVKTRILGKVESVLPGRDIPTYDIEVENEHWFYAGAIKSHNTLSLLAGVTPGVHPAYSKFMIRRIQMASNDKLVALCRKHGYHIEPKVRIDGSLDYDTMVVSFPLATPPDATVASEVTAIDQLEAAKFLQTHWADNSVSVTVYYKKDELPGVQEWLKQNYHSSVKTVSFLLHSEHGFKQAPLEEITEAQYKEMAAKVKPITMIENDTGAEFRESLECANGSCPIK